MDQFIEEKDMMNII